MLASLALGIALLGEAPPSHPPAVLLEPDAALQHAAAQVEAGGPEALLYAAEVALHARNPALALEHLERLELEIESASTHTQRLRLELDARVQRGEVEAGRRVAERLAEHPGWGPHAWRQVGVLDTIERRRGIARLAGGFFALALAALALAGGRELLKVRRPVLILAVVVAGSLLAIAIVSPLLARIAALVELAWIVLAHAASAAAARTVPVPRLRLFIAALLLIGVAGAALAVLLPLPGPFYVEALSRA